MHGTYQPKPETAALLAWCLAEVKALPYAATTRWLFYNAAQNYVPLKGRRFTKKDYKNFIHLLSRARKAFYGGWTPATLMDDKREIHQIGGGWDTPAEWFESFRERTCTLDKRRTQNKIIILCYEAQAMHRQFEYYTEEYYVSLVPFSGDASIDHKWKLARMIDDLHQYYELPVKILYFGDLDEKGMQIPKSAIRDVRAWCRTDFEYARIGLCPEHVERWSLIENPEKPGYQWEAMSDAAARELIIGALDAEIDRTAIWDVLEREEAATDRWKQAIGTAIDDLTGEEE